MESATKHVSEHGFATVHIQLDSMRKQLCAMVRTEILPDLDRLIGEAIEDAKDISHWKDAIDREVRSHVKDRIRLMLSQHLDLRQELSSYLASACQRVITDNKLSPVGDNTGAWAVKHALDLIAVEKDLRELNAPKKR